MYDLAGLLSVRRDIINLQYLLSPVYVTTYKFTLYGDILFINVFDVFYALMFYEYMTYMVHEYSTLMFLVRV